MYKRNLDILHNALGGCGVYPIITNRPLDYMLVTLSVTVCMRYCTAQCASCSRWRGSSQKVTGRQVVPKVYTTLSQRRCNILQHPKTQTSPVQQQAGDASAATSENSHIHSPQLQPATLADSSGTTVQQPQQVVGMLRGAALPAAADSNGGNGAATMITPTASAPMRAGTCTQWLHAVGCSGLQWLHAVGCNKEAAPGCQI